MGPLAQSKKMFEKGRIIATSLYFGAMFLTLWMAVKVQQQVQFALQQQANTLCATVASTPVLQ